MTYQQYNITKEKFLDNYKVYGGSKKYLNCQDRLENPPELERQLKSRKSNLSPEIAIDFVKTIYAVKLFIRSQKTLST